MNFGQRRRQPSICYKCQKQGHIARYCQEKDNNEHGSEYSSWICIKKGKKGIKSRNSSTPLELEEIIEKYPATLKYLDRKVQFRKVGKCQKNTPDNKIIIKRGQLIPQSREEDARIYIDDLVKRNIIRESKSQRRSPIRFV